MIFQSAFSFLTIFLTIFLSPFCPQWKNFNAYTTDYQTNIIVSIFSASEFENKTEFNRFRKKRFVNEKRLKSYPAVKICRFGVDVSTHNLHLGSKLLNFIKGYFVINNKTGCRFITVDAYIDAVPFYLKNNFLELTSSDEDASHTRLLYYDLKMMV